MLKESENPPVKWPDDIKIKNYQGTWWVAHTKSRNEKALAWQLKNKAINYFLPMSWKISQNKGRKIKSLLPLFSGYMFFCGDENDRLEVLRTNRVAGLIEVKNQDRIIADLTPIETAIASDEILRPEPTIVEGEKCRVLAGPLMGTEGIVIKTHNKYRLILQVEMLGQATSVDIDAEMLEIIKD